MKANAIGWIVGFAMIGLFFWEGGFRLNPTSLVVLFIVAVIAKNILRGNKSGGEAASTSGFGRNWEEAGHELGLKTLVRTKRGATSTMRGEIEGHRVKVNCRRGGEPEIEVRFESDLRMVDIDPRRKPIGSYGSAEVITGDPAFDEAYRVAARSGVHTAELLDWLTPERREILVVLGDALAVEEIEEDELEVRLGRSEWTPDELVQAVQLCVLVARVLDKSHESAQDRSPQDALRPPAEAPQDRVIQDAVRPDETRDIA